MRPGYGRDGAPPHPGPPQGPARTYRTGDHATGRQGNAAPGTRSPRAGFEGIPAGSPFPRDSLTNTGGISLFRRAGGIVRRLRGLPEDTAGAFRPGCGGARRRRAAGRNAAAPRTGLGRGASRGPRRPGAPRRVRNPTTPPARPGVGGPGHCPGWDRRRSCRCKERAGSPGSPGAPGLPGYLLRGRSRRVAEWRAAAGTVGEVRPDQTSRTPGSPASTRRRASRLEAASGFSTVDATRTWASMPSRRMSKRW